MININVGFSSWQLNITIFIGCIIFFIWYTKQKTKEETDKLDTVTKNWILLKNDKCPFCIKQMEILGPKKDMFKILDIKDDKKIIKKLKLPIDKGVPCWVNINSKKFQVGLLQMDEIEKL